MIKVLFSNTYTELKNKELELNNFWEMLAIEFSEQTDEIDFNIFINRYKDVLFDMMVSLFLKQQMFNEIKQSCGEDYLQVLLEMSKSDLAYGTPHRSKLKAVQ